MGEMFKDKVVLVTGSGQGVGRAVALAFAGEGAKVVTNNRKPGSTRLVTFTEEAYSNMEPEKKKAFDDIYAGIVGDAESTARTITERGGEAFPYYCDIAVTADVEKMIAAIIEKYGKIDIVINVAGAFGGGPLHEISEELWDRVMSTKPKGYFNVMKYAIPHMMRQKWGRIINCTSRAFMGDTIRHTQYCAANAGVVGLTRGAAVEYFNDGITVNAFGPWARTRASYEAELGSEITIPGMGAFPTAAMTPEAENICPFIMYLCTDYAKDVTGSIFSLAGNEISMHAEPVISRNMLKPTTAGTWTVDEIANQAKRGIFRSYQNLYDQLTKI